MPVFVLVLVVIGGVVLALAALALVAFVVVRRKSRGEASIEPGARATGVDLTQPATAADDSEQPTALDPLVRTSLSGGHSEAAVLAHKPDPLEQAQVLQQQAENEVAVLRREVHEQTADLERREHRLAERETRLDNDARLLDERAHGLAQLEDDVAVRKAELIDVAEDRRRILERLAGLTAEQAKAEVISDIEHDAKRQGAVKARDIESQIQAESQTRARRLLATVIQRVASEQTAEAVVSAVHLPSDDMKGRIIGREGRNIRSFEQTTGVNVIVDETPDAVLLSCFDPVRRETARLTLERLLFDGRIHPSRIEEMHQRSQAEVEQVCQRAGEDALVEAGITTIHPELVTTLGQLKFRTSYGQNVLKHLIESCHIAGLIADELGLDRKLCGRAALLHDIGKALTHEAEGSHAMVGAQLARRLGESEDVVHAIEAHHNEVEPRTVEAIITQAADAISGGRPGARRESLESYVKRLERLEEIARECEGVDKVFAMQAGREVRVMVLPDVVDDIQAQVLARDIAKQVEHELTYPGQIKVTVVRESRATEVAR